MNEEFRPIPGYPDYEVSNLGKVKSYRTGKERILRGCINYCGYRHVSLTNNKGMATKTIHQLMAITFLNHKPCGNKLVIDHINTIKTDNRLENLQIITNRKNVSKDKIDLGICWDKMANKWKAQIMINKKKKSLGYFTKKQKALNAYQTALNNLNE